jgi:hypothetical protein
MARPSELLDARQTVGIVYGLLRGYEVAVLADELNLYTRQVLAVRRKLKRLKPKESGYGCRYYDECEYCEGCLDRDDDWVCPYAKTKGEKK